MSGVWKIALQFSFPDKGIAVNSWNVSVKINNVWAPLCVSVCFPCELFILTLSALAFMHKTVAKDFRREVNQSNVSSRLEAVSSGPESAIFQLLSKNMCSRYGYRSRAKLAADRINHMSFIVVLKKEVFCVQRFVVLAEHTALQSLFCLSVYTSSDRLQEAELQAFYQDIYSDYVPNTNAFYLWMWLASWLDRGQFNHYAN